MPVRLLHYSDLENAYDDWERIARLGGTIESLRDESTLVLGSGDNLASGVLPATTDVGQLHALPFFDAVEPDADTLGNHDVDHGPEQALELLDETPQQWVCANVADERFASDGPVVPTTVFDVGDASVGVFGVAHPETPSLAPAASGLTFTDPVAAAQEAVTALRERGVDYVVGLSHLGEDDDLAAAVDADVVLGGHRHSRRVDAVDGTVLARTSGNGEDLVEVVLDDGIETTIHETTDGRIDDDIAATYRERWRAAGLNETIASVETPVERTYASRFHGESRVGNHLADAYRWATGADLAVVAGGAIRLGPPLVGSVTVGDVVGTVPFPNDLVVVRVPGSDVRSLFHEAHGGGPDSEPPWWHLHVSGGRVVWDAADERVVTLEVDGEHLDDGATYAVATSSFLCDLDGFPALSSDAIEENYGTQFDHVVAYTRERGLDPSVEERIERRNLDETSGR